MVSHIHWLGHASFRISAEITIYIDPWKIASRAASADIVLISHGHYDHMSREDIDRIRCPRTQIIVPQSCLGTIGREAIGLAPGEEKTVHGVKIQAVRAYNVNKPFHPKENDWLGYVIHLPNETIYYAGDTSLIPEMSHLSVDIALLPIGGTYTMNAEEAVEAAERVNAQLAIPMHWGEIVGKQEDADRFVQLAAAKGIKTKILDAER